jgi:hypothetical protein
MPPRARRPRIPATYGTPHLVQVSALCRGLEAQVRLRAIGTAIAFDFA